MKLGSRVLGMIAVLGGSVGAPPYVANCGNYDSALDGRQTSTHWDTR
jgi:hypothetical protein